MSTSNLMPSRPLLHQNSCTPPNFSAIADTGCTGHFLPMNSPHLDPLPTTNGITVALPNNQRIQASHTCQLALPQLPAGARQAHLFQNLAHPLLSISQLCDQGCTATFDALQVRIERDGQLILHGQRDPTTNLWAIPLLPTKAPTSHLMDKPLADQGPGCCSFPLPLAHANSAYHTTTQRDHVTFLHAACGYPVPTTWIQAIDRGHFATWPGLTSELVRKHLPKSIPTIKGHLHQQRQNIRSTRADIIPNFDDDATPAPDAPNVGTHLVFSAVAELPRHEIATDLTGQFPTTSSQGNKYILVCYVYDCNAIITTPMKNRTELEHMRAFNHIHQYLTMRGFTPTHQRLDNEASTAFKNNLRQKGIDYQLVPPHNHRRNAAERAIQTFKNHFISILCGTDKRFPMHLWCRLLPQATATLNLLRTSRLHPQLSAEAHLNGAFDFNRTPLAPLGTQVILHETPQQRKTWAAHGVDGWYIGYAPEHYRCYTVYVTKTNATRIGTTVEFLPTQVAMPKTSSADTALRAALDLIDALRNPTPAAPIAPIGLQQLQALHQLADIFRAALPPTPAAPPRVPTPPATPPRVPTPPATDTPAATLEHPFARRAPSLPHIPAPTLAHGNSTPASATPGDPRPTPAVVTPPKPRPALIPAPAQRSPRVLFSGHKYPTRLQTTTHQPHLINQVSVITPSTMAAIMHPDQPTHAIPAKHMANAVLDPITGQAMEYRALVRNPTTAATWTRSYANELGRLAQGVGGRIHGTDTIFFIPIANVPTDRTVTYGRIVCDYRPQKTEPERTRLTVGGNLIDYPYDVSTDTSDLTTAKLVINSTISTPGARHVLIDLKNYYLGTPMTRYEYMRLAIDTLPAEIVAQYKLRDIAHNGFVYVEIRRGMYGLPQAGIIANNQLVKRLAPFGYAPVTHTPGLWRHKTRPILFSLVRLSGEKIKICFAR
jgi:hypothetical protein